MSSNIEEQLILENIYKSYALFPNETDKKSSANDYSNFISNNSDFSLLPTNDISFEGKSFKGSLTLEEEEGEIIKVAENSSQLDSESEFNKLFNCIKEQIPSIEPSPSNPPNPNFNQKIEISNSNSNTRKYFRVDDAKKHFKVAISKFATETINSLIKKSKLPSRLKKTIHLPNFKKFTSNVKELDNYEFLSYDMKTIFIYGKDEENLQMKNEEIISKILNYKKNPKEIEAIKEFLSKKYEEIIQDFYRSENFIKFKEKNLTNFFSQGIKILKQIDLLENDKLIDMFKMTNKKRKREIFTTKTTK